MEEARRRQVEDLSSDIDAALTDAKGRSVKQYTDYATENPFMAAMLSTAGAASPGDMQRQTYEQVHRSEHIPTKEAEQLHNEIVELEAAQRSMRDAKRIIGEADTMHRKVHLANGLKVLLLVVQRVVWGRNYLTLTHGILEALTYLMQVL